MYPITVRNNRYENSFKFLTVNLADLLKVVTNEKGEAVGEVLTIIC